MKTMISEDTLNKMISRSIKNILEGKKEIISEGFKVDFQKMGPPSKYPNFIKNIENGGSFKDKRLTYAQDKYRSAYRALKNGNYSGSAKQAIGVLRNFGYTDEEIKYAIDNKSFMGTDRNGVNQINIERKSFNNVGKAPESPYMDKSKKQFTLREFCDAVELSDGLVDVDALINAIKKDGVQFNENGTGNYVYWKEWFNRNGKYFGQNFKKVKSKIESMEPYINQETGEIDNNPFSETGKEDYDNMKVGKTGNYTLDPNNLNNITEIIHRIQSVYAQGGDKDANFTALFDDSTGIFNTTDVKGKVNPDQVREQIMRKMKQAANTLKIVNPDTKETYYQMLEGWLNGTRPYRQREIAQCLSAIGTVIDTSRNEIPATRGLQKALNYFNIKDSKGRKFAVDGVIGPETSAALKNAGFKDIYEWKQTIYNYQQKYNVPPKPDGLVGDNTIDSFRSNGISSLQQLNLFKPERIANQEKWNSYGRVNVDMPKPKVTMTTQPQPGIGRPGFVTESKKQKDKILNKKTSSTRGIKKINESTLNKIIFESIKKNILNENFTFNFKEVGNPQNMNPAYKNGGYDFTTIDAWENKLPDFDVIKQLYNGTYAQGKRAAWNELKKIGYTDAEIVNAVNKNLFTSNKEGQNRRLAGLAGKRGYVQKQNAPSEEEPTQDAKAIEDNEQSIANWNNLGVPGQLKLIQGALDMKPEDTDGRLGPQTTATIAIALANNGNEKMKTSLQGAGINLETLKRATLTKGKNAVYTAPTPQQ